VRDCLASHPVGLLLDLRDLDDPEAASGRLWLDTADRAAEMCPTVPVVASPPSGTALATVLTVPRPRQLLTALPTTSQARDVLVSRRPRIEQFRLRLPPRLSVAVGARDLVTAACRQWNMSALRDLAPVVAGELVVNAVEHAGTALEMIVSRHGPSPAPAHGHGRLRLAVVDHRPLTTPLPRPPILAPISTNERGSGLRIVDRASEAWGVLPTRSGKVVWSILNA